ncbi:MAG: hypothetical protein M3Z14_04690, partial [Candidatus Eremiobacteraeota bacterium]|nr:hypothetical protein [Candidatus Eremiobacteraeota bacterium]
MARVRRKATAKTRLNFEIAGIAALGLAVLFGIALTLPATHSGFMGSATAPVLRGFFGRAAGLFPVLIALFAAIIFLEINVPRLMATLGLTALSFFLIIDAALGRSGGSIGWNMWRGLTALTGVLGARLILIGAVLVLTVWVTDISLKKFFGLCMAAISRLRLPEIRLPKIDIALGAASNANTQAIAPSPVLL